MKLQPKPPVSPDTPKLIETSRNLRLLVQEAAARLRQARIESAAARVARGIGRFGKGNGERYNVSRY